MVGRRTFWSEQTSATQRMGKKRGEAELCQRQVRPCKIGVWRNQCLSGNKVWISIFRGGRHSFRQAK